MYKDTQRHTSIKFTVNFGGRTITSCDPPQLSPVTICWLLKSTDSLKDTLQIVSFEGKLNVVEVLPQ